MGFFVASPSSASAPAQSFPMATGNVHPSAGHGSAAKEPLSVTVDGTSGIVAASSGPAKATVKKRRGAHVSIDGFWKVAGGVRRHWFPPTLFNRLKTLEYNGKNARPNSNDLLLYFASDRLLNLCGCPCPSCPLHSALTSEDLKVDPTAPPAAPLIRRSLTVTPKGSNAMTETGTLLPAGEDEVRARARLYCVDSNVAGCRWRCL